MRIAEDVGGIAVRVELPDGINGIPAGVHLAINPRTEEEVAAVVQSLGGVEAFETISSAVPYLTIRKGDAGVIVHVPEDVARGGKARYPMLEALRGLQESAEQEAQA